MFPINHSFFIPMVFYTHPQFLFPNAQILSMNPNLYLNTKIQLESSMTLPSCQQIDRQSSHQLQKNQIRISIKEQDKRRQIFKKKIIEKKIFKQANSDEQAERLRKKLANRPKTYQTEKKMYMNTDLTTLGCSDQGGRTLRKRPSPIKKIKILKQKLENQDSDISHKIHQSDLPINEEQSKKQIDNILGKFQKILQFYDPHAVLPKAECVIQDNKQIELKKSNLLYRKVDFANQSSF